MLPNRLPCLPSYQHVRISETTRELCRRAKQSEICASKANPIEPIFIPSHPKMLSSSEDAPSVAISSTKIGFQMTAQEAHWLAQMRAHPRFQSSQQGHDTDWDLLRWAHAYKVASAENCKLQFDFLTGRFGHGGGQVPSAFACQTGK